MKTRLWVFGGFLTAATVAVACCAVSMTGRGVQFAGQANIIVWEAESKTEHFIRSAKFETEADNLGFIAPTPTLPDLAEVDAAAFKDLARAIRDYQLALKPLIQNPFTMSKGAAGGLSTIVRVVDVAGYEATTLKPDDAQGLSSWMKLNGYVTSPDTTKWIAFYVKKGWFFTAFKVKAKDGKAATGLVKMSFKTDRPFNPYYVPADNMPTLQSDRLYVYFVATGRYSVSPSVLREDAVAPLVGRHADELQKHLKLASLPKDATITAFIDDSFPNPKATDDLYFTYSEPGPEFPSSPWWNVAIVTGSVIIIWLVFRRRRLRMESK